MTQTVIERRSPSVSLAVELETVTLAEHGETLIGVVRGSVIHHDQLEIGIALRVMLAIASCRYFEILKQAQTTETSGRISSSPAPSPGLGANRYPGCPPEGNRAMQLGHIRGAFKRQDTKKNRTDHRNRQVARPGARRTENRKRWRNARSAHPRNPGRAGRPPREKKGRTKEGPAAFLGKLHDLAGTRNHGTAFSPARQRGCPNARQRQSPGTPGIPGALLICNGGEIGI